MDPEFKAKACGSITCPWYNPLYLQQEKAISFLLTLVSS